MKYGTIENRNHGYGKQLEYAGQNALRDSYAGHATRDSHGERWGQFSTWAKEEGLKDARSIDRSVVEDYARNIGDKVASGDITVRYGQNLISSVNQTLIAMREGDRSAWVSPSLYAGERSNVREQAPEISRDALSKAQADLISRGHDRAAATLGLEREFGMRAREAVSLNIDQALRQAARHGEIDIREGAKGGRGNHHERWVTVTEHGLAALEAAKLSADGSRTLIPDDQSRAQFMAHVRDVAIPTLKANSINHQHELRAAYACEQYQKITGHHAPVVAGKRQAPKEVDITAREQISYKLGHNRIDVVASYIGSSK